MQISTSCSAIRGSSNALQIFLHQLRRFAHLPPANRFHTLIGALSLHFYSEAVSGRERSSIPQRIAIRQLGIYIESESVTLEDISLNR